jgi:hypothetical protein
MQSVQQLALLVPLLEVHPLVAGEEVLEAEEPLVIQRE